MEKRLVDSNEAPRASGSYAQALEIRNPSRLLFISGQIPVGRDGAAPSGFDDQCRLVWANIEAQLRAADMTFDNLVKVTTFLADRRDGEANSRIRQAVLGARRPALTIVISGIYNSQWLLEIEAVAAA